MNSNSPQLIESLPIYKHAKEFLSLLHQHQVVIIIGETGCGKTTQVPKIIYRHMKESGDSKMICITQPRRVAAISVSLRVAEELHTQIGNEVGYAVRFKERYSSKTHIKFVTDGMLVRESIIDPLLSKYSYIILDEVHERSVHTDILLAITKKLIQSKQRSDLKVIIMSATMDPKLFMDYYNTSALLTVQGRTFPVKVYNVIEEQSSYVDAALACVMQIHFNEKTFSDYNNGDILVFLPGQEDIEDLQELLNSKKKKIDRSKHYEVLLLFSAIPYEEQMRIFQPSRRRKIILATNIAETSITIRNIKYIVDCGYFKMRKYLPKAGLDTLLVTPISKNSAVQRAGRAGRESEGKCFRLYTEKAFEAFKEMTEPEILRINLKNVLLDLMSIGFESVDNIDFIDKPSKDNFQRALNELIALRAINRDNQLTPLGKDMTILPVDPIFSVILINSLNEEFVEVRKEILYLVSILQSDNILYTPSTLKEKIEKIREKFLNPTSDHLTLLNIFLQWLENKEVKTSRTFCHDNFLNEKALMKTFDIANQLEGYLGKIQRKALHSAEEKDKEKVASIEHFIHQIEKKRNVGGDSEENSKKEELIIKCLITGYFGNIARYTNDNFYITLQGQLICKVHPSSFLIKTPKLGKEYEYLIYNDMIVTNKRYLRYCTLVKEDKIKRYLNKALNSII